MNHAITAATVALISVMSVDDFSTQYLPDWLDLWTRVPITSFLKYSYSVVCLRL